MTGFLFPDIAGQLGMASTRQLVSRGASEWDLTQLALRGHRVVRGVYRSRVGDLGWEEFLMAGFLWAGPRAAVTGVHALLLHGLSVRGAPDVLRLLVPPQHRARRNTLGMVTERTRETPRRSRRAGVPCVAVERALVDAARHRELSPSRLKGSTIAALQRRLTSLDRLAQEIGFLGDAGTGGIQDGMLAFRAGAWSAPESALAEAVARDQRFPTMLANPRLVDAAGRLVGVPDGYFEDTGVVVQVHSKQFHLGLDPQDRDRWANTLVADTRYHRHGLVVVPVAPQTLADDLEAFLTTLLAVLDANRGRRPTDVFVDNPVRTSEDSVG